MKSFKLIAAAALLTLASAAHASDLYECRGNLLSYDRFSKVVDSTPVVLPLRVKTESTPVFLARFAANGGLTSRNVEVTLGGYFVSKRGYISVSGSYVPMDTDERILFNFNPDNFSAYLSDSRDRKNQRADLLCTPK